MQVAVGVLDQKAPEAGTREAEISKWGRVNQAVCAYVCVVG